MSAKRMPPRCCGKSLGLVLRPRVKRRRAISGEAPAKAPPGRKRKAEKMAQLNLRVPEEIKHRVRILAARDRREMSEIVIEAIKLYEARFGAAPVLEPTRES